MKSEANMKTEILERLAPGELRRGLHRDPRTPARFLVFGYIIDTFVCSWSLFPCSFILQKAINNRLTPSQASDRGTAQHCLLATSPFPPKQKDPPHKSFQEILFSAPCLLPIIIHSLLRVITTDLIFQSKGISDFYTGVFPQVKCQNHKPPQVSQPQHRTNLGKENSLLSFIFSLLQDLQIRNLRNC